MQQNATADPAGGAYSALPNPVGFKAAAERGSGREGRRREGRRSEREERGRKGAEEEGREG